MWRVWKRTGTPLNEIFYEWTYEQVMKANAVLDMYDAMDIAMNQIEEPENKSGV